MANTQSKNDPLEQISKLIAENTEIKKKYAEVEAENAKLKEIIKQSTRREAEYEARIKKLEQSDKEKAGLKTKFEALERKNKMDTANLTVENIELKTRVAKLEQKQSQTDGDAKGIDQSSVNTISTKMKNSNDTPASNISDNTSNSDVAPERIENSSVITSDSYTCQERDSQYSTSPIPPGTNSDIYQPVCTEPKSLEDKEIDNFLVERHNEQISNEIRERNREKKLQAQDLSSVNTSKLPDDLIIKLDKNLITERELKQQLSMSISIPIGSDQLRDQDSSSVTAESIVYIFYNGPRRNTLLVLFYRKI